MMNAQVLTAFFAGCGIALLLETWHLLRTHVQSWRLGLFAGLALFSFVGAGWSGLRSQPPLTTSTAPSTRSITAVTKSDSHTPLPAPRINHLFAQNTVDEAMRTAVPQQMTGSQPVRLQIPALAIDKAIQPVPVRDGRWDVSDLGSQVGLLATTGQSPSDGLAMVFAGHMTFANANLLESGAFAELQYATYGTKIIVQTEDNTMIYEVSEIHRIPPDAVDALYLEDNNSILLITCTDWTEAEGVYANRLLVRAQRQ